MDASDHELMQGLVLALARDLEGIQEGVGPLMRREGAVTLRDVLQEIEDDTLGLLLEARQRTATAAELYVERNHSTDDPEAPHFWLFDGWREVDDLLSAYRVEPRQKD